MKTTQFSATVHVTVFLGCMALAGSAFLNGKATFWIIVFLVIGVVFAVHGVSQERNSSSRGRETKEAKEGLGRILEKLSACELKAYRGSNASEYYEVLQDLGNLEKEVEQLGMSLDDPSCASRYRAVNVLDVQLDEATKMHFLSRAQGDFWAVFQKTKAQRATVVEIMKELD